jgi:hypothetical protein
LSLSEADLRAFGVGRSALPGLAPIDPALGGANPPSPTMQYRILDKKTGEVKLDSGVGSVASFVRPGNPLVPFATRLAVAELPAGSYRLEVRAANPSVQDAVARTVDFELQ